jgi:hypothetical protein
MAGMAAAAVVMAAAAAAVMAAAAVVMEAAAAAVAQTDEGRTLIGFAGPLHLPSLPKLTTLGTHNNSLKRAGELLVSNESPASPSVTTISTRGMPSASGRIPLFTLNMLVRTRSSPVAVYLHVRPNDTEPDGCMGYFGEFGKRRIGAASQSEGESSENRTRARGHPARERKSVGMGERTQNKNEGVASGWGAGKNESSGRERGEGERG